MAELNPLYINSIIDKVTKAVNGDECNHAAMALVTQAYACIMETGVTQMTARKTLREMLDYAVKNSIDQEKIRKEMKANVHNHG